MAFNFYDTHTLLASVQQLPPLHSFLLDRYFPTNASVQQLPPDRKSTRLNSSHSV